MHQNKREKSEFKLFFLCSSVYKGVHERVTIPTVHETKMFTFTGENLKFSPLGRSFQPFFFLVWISLQMFTVLGQKMFQHSPEGSPFFSRVERKLPRSSSWQRQQNITSKGEAPIEIAQRHIFTSTPSHKHRYPEELQKTESSIKLYIILFYVTVVPHFYKWSSCSFRTLVFLHNVREIVSLE